MKKWTSELLPYLIVLFVVLLMKQFVISPIRVNGDSMNPTLKDGDIMLLNKIGYRFQEMKRFDIVVIHDHETDIIKRIIGLPGETISCVDGIIYIDGKELKEPFSHEETEDFEEVQIEKDHYFIMGDNRVDSLDSRVLGALPKSEFLGHATYTILPFSRFGSKK